jgi:hypothetical protein
LTKITYIIDITTGDTAMAKKKFTTKVKGYVKDVKELRKMRTLRSTRLGDIDRKYESLVKRSEIVQDLAINNWLDGKITSQAFSGFVTRQNDEDFGENCLEYVESIMDEGGEDWLLENC